nr:hypothetical protein [Halorubellus sp. JP-L1]
MVVILVVTFSRAARQALRNACRTHEDAVVRRFGRAALFEATGFGAFLGLRLRERHGGDVQVERTQPLNEFSDAVASARAAAEAYERRKSASTPYAKFAAGRDLPSKERLREQNV